MTSDQLLVLVIVVIGFVIVYAIGSRNRIGRRVSGRVSRSSESQPLKAREPSQPFMETERPVLSEEEVSEAELERLQNLIQDRKRFARETDISYHLWSLYESQFRFMPPQAMDRQAQDSKWYDVKTLQTSTQNGLNTFEFELKGKKYKFIDDEDKQGWRETIKFFSLFLYDDSDHCLIEIPMKLRVHGSGRTYSILSHGPEAFLRGEWVSDFIHVILKHKRIRNQDIRAQKHQERLREIEELKGKFGITDSIQE